MFTGEVRARVEPELKRNAVAILKAFGLDKCTTIRHLFRSVVETGGLPIELLRDNPQPWSLSGQPGKASSGKWALTTFEHGGRLTCIYPRASKVPAAFDVGFAFGAATTLKAIDQAFSG